MSNSYQSEIPKARVNIQLSLHTGGAQKKIELPLKLMVIGDYSNGAEQRPVAGDGSEESVSLSFSEMKDFEPEQIARQIPQLRAMLAMRNLLRDLKASPLPAGESAALWVVGADAPVVMPRGEFYDASASEPLNLICERAVAQCDLHDDPPACVLFSHPQITRLDECGWNTTHNLQDSYWGMQGSMEPLIVISLAALFAKTEAQPCGWVSTDPQHTLALGIVKPHGKG
jgi:hypothetical protein